MRARDGTGDVGPELLAELLDRGHRATLRARGNSMSPLVRDGDLLLLAPLETPPRTGDVVVALSGAQLIAHRVCNLDAAGAELQGDAMWRGDGWFASVKFIYKELVYKKNVYKRSAGPTAAAAQAEARIIGRAISLRRGGVELGCWRLSGKLARVWLAVLPLVRSGRGVARRAARLASFASSFASAFASMRQS